MALLALMLWWVVYRGACVAVGVPFVHAVWKQRMPLVSVRSLFCLMVKASAIKNQ